MALHVVAIAALVTIPMHVLHPPTYITLLPAEEPGAAAPFGGTRVGGGAAGGPRAVAPRSARTPGRARLGAPPVPRPGPPAPVAAPLPPVALGPRLGDGRLWVSPRPALPGEVAEALYGRRENRDSLAVRRLGAMVDSLNQVLDAIQRGRQRPTWTTEVAGAKFGIDSQFIHIAGIKIPVMALSLLPIHWPEANFGEMEYAERLRDMREDLLRSARRTETLHDFRRYVGELRARKDAEREAARRTRQRPDTARAVP